MSPFTSGACLTLLPFLQETHQEVPGWLQSMGTRAPTFGGKRRGGGGGNRFGGQDFRRDNGNHCKSLRVLVTGCYRLQDSAFLLVQNINMFVSTSQLLELVVPQQSYLCMLLNTHWMCCYRQQASSRRPRSPEREYGRKPHSRSGLLALRLPACWSCSCAACLGRSTISKA